MLAPDTVEATLDGPEMVNLNGRWRVAAIRDGWAGQCRTFTRTDDQTHTGFSFQTRSEERQGNGLVPRQIGYFEQP